MGFCRPPLKQCLLLAVAVGISAPAFAQSSSKPSTSPDSSASHAQKPTAHDSAIDAGPVADGIYRNKALALSVKIPAGWVLRTQEMNAPPNDAPPSQENDQAAAQRATEHGCSRNCGKVLLAAFSRPPEAHGEEVNASIVIAAESVESYPGLKEPAQYFGPLTEVAKAQGFTTDEGPYEIDLGGKVVVRGDFHKNVGRRVMQQSTLVFLSHGYAVSITVIGGSEDEVESLIEGVTLLRAK